MPTFPVLDLEQGAVHVPTPSPAVLPQPYLFMTLFWGGVAGVPGKEPESSDPKIRRGAQGAAGCVCGGPGPGAAAAAAAGTSCPALAPWLRLSLPQSVLPCLSPKVEATPARRGRGYTCCTGSWAPDIAEAVGVSSHRPDPVGIPPPPTRGAPLCRFSPGSSPLSMCPVPPLPGSFANPHSVPSVAPPQVCVCLSVCLGHL